MAPVRRRQNRKSRSDEPILYNAGKSDLLEGFRRRVLTGRALQAELRRAKTVSDIIRLAAKEGFAITRTEVKRLQNVAKSPVKLTEAELERIAGALPCWCNPSVVNSKSCKKKDGVVARA